MGLRDQIANVKNKAKVRKVETPEWGPDAPCVWVRKLTADEVMRVAKIAEDSGASDDEFLVWFSAFVIVEENGERSFDDKSEEDRRILGGRDPDVLLQIIEEARSFNTMTLESRDTMEKN